MSSKNYFTFGHSVLLCGLMTLLTLALHAGPVAVPNASFESPLAPRDSLYAIPVLAEWQITPPPKGYDSSTNGTWEFNFGTFYNVPFPGYFIDNADGEQAAFLFAVPDAGLFQDYNSSPGHAFDATFEVGNAYDLTVGVIASLNMTPGATLQLGLYYRDALSNVVLVATTSVTHSVETFPSNTHLVDFQVHLPVVQTGDPWAGQKIGIQILSTIGSDQNLSYWDLDNVRLVKTPAPTLLNSAFTTNGFTFTVNSEPGQTVEMFTTTNLLTVASNWTSLGVFTNFTGTTNFSDSITNAGQRFYRAQAR
ncbi:MAG: hypothetical protein WCH99_03410 [Verrucomicrobiota bacterium]